MSLQKAFPIIFSRRRFRIAFIVLVLLFPLQNVLAEAARFLDPVYRSRLEPAVSLYAKQLAGANRIIWHGRPYPIRPAKHSFHPGDQYMYQYDFFAHVVTFFADKEVMIFPESEVFFPHDFSPMGFIQSQMANKLEDGDALILHGNSIVVQRVLKRVFDQFDEGPQNLFHFRNTEWAEARLTIQAETHELKIEGVGIPDGFYELSIRYRDDRIRMISRHIDVKQGRFDTIKQDQPPNLAIENVILLTFDSAREFSTIQN